MENYTEFINRLFESREQTHVFHLQTKSHSEHIALQGYYEGILEYIDIMVEAWQGKYRKILDGYDIINNNSFDKSSPLKYFIELSMWIEDKKVTHINKVDTFLLSIVDDILILIYQTIYKLEFLK